ncbi:hypothetical protein BG015_000755 [Linnemannia schmuckeri]|uniref:Uncharacterized protein n=1 Tax=Linnemannia schmuckeri TaxID=64567 RepID=A0A9P5V787_9FUNG|nr:hypothetical protein BG015_000755 [Linnemannia schmuckeri]
MLFNSTDPAVWDSALALYPEAFKALAATKSDQSIIALDKWYQTEFPSLLASRSPCFINHEEIVKLVAWKLKRGKYRPALAKMVAEHTDAVVRRTSQEAFDIISSKNDLKAAISKMSELKGVGPATASAILCAGAPDKVPFMADESVDSVPGLGKIAYNLTYYLKFAAKVIDKAEKLKEAGSKVNSPHLVELALWADMMAEKFDLPAPSPSSSSAVAPAAGTNKRKANEPSAVAPPNAQETQDAKENDSTTTNKKARSTRSSSRK